MSDWVFFFNLCCGRDSLSTQGYRQAEHQSTEKVYIHALIRKLEVYSTNTKQSQL